MLDTMHMHVDRGRRPASGGRLLLPCFLLVVGRHLDNLRSAAVVDRSCRLQLATCAQVD